MPYRDRFDARPGLNQIERYHLHRELEPRSCGLPPIAIRDEEDADRHHDGDECVNDYGEDLCTLHQLRLGYDAVPL